MKYTVVIKIHRYMGYYSIGIPEDAQRCVENNKLSHGMHPAEIYFLELFQKFGWSADNECRLQGIKHRLPHRIQIDVGDIWVT